MRVARVLWQILTSKKLALYLIVIITTGIVVASIFPQESYLSRREIQRWTASFPFLAHIAQRLGLTHFYSSAWFLVLAALFFANTFCCTVEQIRQIVKIERRRRQSRPSHHWPDRFELTGTHSPSVLISRTAEFFRRQGFAVQQEGDWVHAEKNRAGRWGTAFFHASLLLILCGVLLGSLTKFEGFLQLAEGQTVVEAGDAYLATQQGLFFRRRQPGMEITLDRVEVVYPKSGKPDDFRSRITIREQGRAVKEAEVTKRDPLAYGGFTFYQRLYGYAPALQIRDGRGREIFGAFVSLATEEVPGGHLYRDIFSIPGTGLEVEAQFYPDLSIGGDYLNRRTYLPVRPGLVLTVREKSRVLFQGSIRPGEGVQAGVYQVSFPEWRRWSGLTVTRDEGRVIVYLGFVLAIAGLTMMYLVVPKEIQVNVRATDFGAGVIASGRAGRYRHLFADEWAELMQKFEAYLTGD